jgi:predicted amidohydrolase YtcJ
VSRALPLVIALGLSACLSSRPPWLGEDYVLVSGGTIYPAPEAAPVEALLIEDGRVKALGTLAEVQAEADEIVARAAGFRYPLEIERIDLAGGTAVPGLVDAHGHLEGLGEALENVDLVGCASIEELIERVAARAAQQPIGTWVLGRGWDQTLWPGVEFPLHDALSARVPDHPVYLERVDGHAAFVNALALERAGLLAPDAAAQAPAGGRIVLDAAGRPSGVLVDAATALVASRIPPPDAAARERRVLAAQTALLAAGLTGMHDMGTAPETLAVLRALERDGRLKLRVASYVWANEGLAGFGRLSPERDLDAKLRVVGAKLMLDGALGSRGAALLAPYADAPDEQGLMQLTPEVFAQRLEEVVRAGLQPATHAIGDRANRVALDAYAHALGGRSGARLRPRVEHAQVVAPEDWERFEALGVIPSMQPTHATSDMRWAEARLGPERVAGAYAWRRLSGPRAPLACGSDFPVESPSPLAGLYAARTRQDAHGAPAGGWLPAQRLDGAAALAGFTTGAAFAAHEEERRGRLAPGCAADLTVLSVDPIRCPPEALLAARVLATVVDGELVFSALSSDPAP